MPTYVYKTREVRNCACTWPGIRVQQRMSDDPLSECPACGQEVYRAIQRPKWIVRHSLRGDMHEYRSDLARFPGDPEAYTDGPRSVSKLWDLRRRRDGWVEGPGWDAIHDSEDGACRTLPNEDNAMQEAYEEAAATGFSLDDPDVQGLLEDGPPPPQS